MFQGTASLMTYLITICSEGLIYQVTHQIEGEFFQQVALSYLTCTPFVDIIPQNNSWFSWNSTKRGFYHLVVSCNDTRMVKNPGNESKCDSVLHSLAFLFSY